QAGNNAWIETFSSGIPLVGIGGSARLGTVQSGALEDSNVNLTEELVKLIMAQRNFQANAQVIQTEDRVTQTLMNIR
ncbi:MAG TPA: flagellar hook protein FlgE, partial [Gammaproteobacteria bacterium]|nr:flagellar hook protein FlgE [Gammaproteobacteria bacterium]MCH78195.1 flagellar hook protein FlgE [Gammaproteobacteria bacterium]